MKTLEQILLECKDKSDFKPHMMYDPKTGKGYKADTYADHVKYDKMGYTHEKPEMNEVSQGAMVQKAIDIASSMGGDMTGAVKRIEKIKRGLSKNKNVAKALRLANEETVSEANLQQLKRKHKRHIDAFNKNNKALPSNVEKDLMKFAMDNDGIGDDPDDFDDWLVQNIEETVSEMENDMLQENYRTLARKGMGTETKGQVKVGQEMDFYETERGDKVFGKVIKVSPTGYIVQAMERGNNKKYSFRYHDRVKAKKLLQNESVSEDGQYVSPSQMTDKQKADLKAKQQAERERRMRQMKMGQKDSEEERARKQRERERRLKQYAGKKESVNEVLNYHTGVEGKKVADQMHKIKSMKPFAARVARMKKLNSYDLEKVVGIGKKKEIETVMQKAFATEAFKPYMNKDYPRIVDFYIQFRGGKGDRITSPDNKKDYEKALKLTQAFMRKNKITSKLETGTPEQGSSAYKIGLILNSKKPEYRVDLRPLVDQIAKLKTAEDHGGGYDKPLKEGKSFNQILEEVISENIQKVVKMYPRDNNWKKLVMKHRRAIDDFRKGKNLKGSAETDLINWAMNNGEIKSDDSDEVDNFLQQILDEQVVTEVTDVEINLMKQLSKDAQKLKKNYSLIVKAGDKELKDRKYNKEWKTILDMQQAVLSLIGKLQTKKIIDDSKVRKESLEEKLSKQDLKFMSMMYDKKGKLTDVGKAVMNYKPGDNIRKIVQNLNKKEAVSPAQQAAIAISKKEKGEKPIIDESRARRDAMRGMKADPDFQPKGFKDIKATDADRKAASKNVLMQIRKATDLPKGVEIEFPSGKKGKISQADAKKVDKMFNVLKKPQDKEKFQKVISKDLNSIKSLLKRLGR